MLKKRLLLSAVTGGISFGLSLLILRDFKMASYTGLMGFVASQAGVLVTSSQQEEHLHERREELQGHIRALQRRRAIVYEELTALQAQHEEFSLRVQQAMATAASASSEVAAEAPRDNPWVPQPQNNQRVSWDLAEPRQSITDVEIDDLNERISYLSKEEETLKRSVADTLNQKQKTELHLTTSEAELQQLHADIKEQEALKHALNQTILELEQDQQQLQANIPHLQAQIQDLESQRRSLEANDSQHQETTSDAGVVALQGAIDQMQAQIVALRSELGNLETQIIDRRSEKQALELAITQLQQEKSESQAQRQAPIATPEPQKSSTDTRLPAVSKPEKRLTEPQRASTITPSKPAESTVSKAKRKSRKRQATEPTAKVEAKTTPQSTSGLPEEWISFKGKLQPYEFQALCAIALEANPTGVLKQLAENNLTMPEMLIDTINEQALDAIGDLILEAGHDAASTIIAQEYRDEVATLIATHR